MPAPIIPWMPSNIPGEIQAELNRRKKNRSYDFIGNRQATWDKDGTWNSYKGPMTSWVRLCSNGGGHPLTIGSYGGSKERFVLYSGKGFYDGYGFKPPTSVGGPKQQIIGYTPGQSVGGIIHYPSEPHIIENSLMTPSGEPENYPIHVPSPEISRIEVTVQKELFRRAQVEWVCFSWKQLVYMTPYFLVPGITCMLEWGWNHFNIESLVNLADRSKMREYWDNAYPLYTDNIIQSKGNYDVLYGIVSNFNWSIEGNKIICTTEITSKDRLYAGMAKDYGLTIKGNDPTNKDEPAGLFNDIRTFFKEDSTIQNLNSLVTKAPVVNAQLISLIPSNNNNAIWRDILMPLLTPSPDVKDAKLAAEQIGMRMPHVFGVFSGRPQDSYDTKPIVGAPGVVGEGFGKPRDSDFDKDSKQTFDNTWVNMGMIVAILNYFSTQASGTNKGKSMFEVDIQNAVIGGHPNLISCDPRVLIPNHQAPKYFYGKMGEFDANGQRIDENKTTDGPGTYSYQVLRRFPIANSIPNQKLRKLLYQQDPNNCYRNNLDEVINYNRYRYAKVGKNIGILPLNSYSFPSAFGDDKDPPLPVSPRGLPGDKLEKDRSGLLSNIYIRLSVLKDIIDNDKVVHYTEIYKEIFTVLMGASDNFWDLALVEIDGTITITDRKYVSRYALKRQGDVVYSFDYYDADSIIKSIKFRPVMSDAQATRVMYGEVNNKDSKFRYLDRNDILDYQFKDCVIGIPENKKAGVDGGGDLEKRKTAIAQQKDLVRSFQKINSGANDGTLQMSLNAYRKGAPFPKVLRAGYTSKAPTDMPEIIKLVMPSQKLLTLLLNDEDEVENGRYCAVQPNITLELTLQGIGGLRTFQYFLVNHLPPPYSDREIIFRITDVQQTLEAGNWETTIRAQPLPLRVYIKERLIGPLGISIGNNGWPHEAGFVHPLGSVVAPG